jgi:hypothetical protein
VLQPPFTSQTRRAPEPAIEDLCTRC